METKPGVGLRRIVPLGFRVTLTSYSSQTRMIIQLPESSQRNHCIKWCHWQGSINLKTVLSECLKANLTVQAEPAHVKPRA